MEILLSATAFLIAMTSLWFASHALRKMDTQFTEFIENNIKGVKNEVAMLNQAVASLTSRLLKIEKDRTLHDKQEEILKKIEAIKGTINELQQTAQRSASRLRRPPSAAKSESTEAKDDPVT
ncbi:MAG: hypothetical protein RIB59_16945 [Rhodospirillales bacterium]